MFQELLLTFIPLFVALDVLGMFPLFLALTSNVDLPTRRALSRQAVVTAFVVALLIVSGGKGLFKILGITIADFKIAGGLILLLISIQDLSTSTDHLSKQPADPLSVGVVPLGIPLILGPAVLTTLLILVDLHGYVMTMTALILNLALVYAVFYYSNHIKKFLGKNAAGAIGKVAALFLAAIAVMMIRKGLVESGIVSLSGGIH